MLVLPETLPNSIPLERFRSGDCANLSPVRHPELWKPAGSHHSITRNDVAAAKEVSDSMPTVDTIIHSLNNCREWKEPAHLKYVYTVICDCGLEVIASLSDCLISSFMECGSIADAEKVFNKLNHHNGVALVCILQGYIECGDWLKAFSLLQTMRGDFDCDRFDINHGFMLLLQACCSRKWLERGQTLHIEMVKEGKEKDPIVGTSLLDMYAKCGFLSEARNVFDSLISRDVVSWTALIGGYTEHGFGEDALHFLEEMRQEGVLMNAVTFVCSLKACGGLRDVRKGQTMHNDIVNYGLEMNHFVCGSLVNMYAEMGMFIEALWVLNKLPYRDVISWNALITGYVDHGLFKEALLCLDEMQAENISPDAITHVCILKACGSSGALEKGRMIHALISKGGFEGDVFIGSTLLGMYAACGSLAEAEKVFQDLCVRDVVSWTALIEGYLAHGLDGEAIVCLDQMHEENISPNGITFVCSLKACGCIDKGRKLHYEIIRESFEKDPFVGNTLVGMYAKCDSLLEALEVFHELPVRNVVSWNVVIVAFLDHGRFEEALNCLEEMESEFVSPDVVTYICCLRACGNIGALEKGRSIHSKVVKEGFEMDNSVCNDLKHLDFDGRVDNSDEICRTFMRGSVKLVLANALIDMYGKCGSMGESQKVFDEMPSRDLMTWTGLVTGYSRQGEFGIVFDLFEKMMKEGIEPDGIVFLNLLNVCSHAGLLDKGEGYFEMMNHFHITRTVEHHNCMVDLFGRAGLLEKAVVLLDEMPFAPDPVIWSTMLCAYQRWGTIELAVKTSDYAKLMKNSSAPTLVLMANMYAASMCED